MIPRVRIATAAKARPHARLAYDLRTENATLRAVAKCEQAVYEMEGKKHVKFEGRLVFVGFGSVGQGSLPLLLRHIDMPHDRISIVTGDERGRAQAAPFGIKVDVRP